MNSQVSLEVFNQITSNDSQNLEVNDKPIIENLQIEVNENLEVFKKYFSDVGFLFFVKKSKDYTEEQIKNFKLNLEKYDIKHIYFFDECKDLDEPQTIQVNSVEKNHCFCCRNTEQLFFFKFNKINDFDIFSKKLEEDMKNYKSYHQKDLESVRAELTHAERKYFELLRDKKRLEHLLTMEDEEFNKLEAKKNLLNSIGYVKNIKFIDGIYFFNFGNIIIKHNGIEYDIGEIQIKYNPKTKTLNMINLSGSNLTGNPHPHVGTCGSFCFGSFSKKALQILDSCNLSKIINMLFIFVNTYDASNPHIRIEEGFRKLKESKRIAITPINRDLINPLTLIEDSENINSGKNNLSDEDLELLKQNSKIDYNKGKLEITEIKNYEHLYNKLLKGFRIMKCYLKNYETNNILNPIFENLKVNRIDKNMCFFDIECMNGNKKNYTSTLEYMENEYNICHSGFELPKDGNLIYKIVLNVDNQTMFKLKGGCEYEYL